MIYTHPSRELALIDTASMNDFLNKIGVKP